MDNFECIEIRFDADYKGKRADERYLKRKTVGSTLFFGVLFAVIGAYVGFWDYHRIIQPYERVIGSVLLALGIFVFVFGPIAALFKKLNNGLKGIVCVTLVCTPFEQSDIALLQSSNLLEKQDSNADCANKTAKVVPVGKWYFTLTTDGKDGIVADQGEVNVLVVQKYFARLVTTHAKEYFIPLRCLSEQQAEQIKQISKQINNYRVAQTAHNE